MNLYQVYYESYQQQAIRHGSKTKKNVLDSAKLIISHNIAQGNFLTKLAPDGNPIVFSEWNAINLRKDGKTIKVQRTEYTLMDILDGMSKEDGESLSHSTIEQLNLFDSFDDEEIAVNEKKQMKYIPVKITLVYKEEMEEVIG